MNNRITNISWYLVMYRHYSTNESAILLPYIWISMFQNTKKYGREWYVHSYDLNIFVFWYSRHDDISPVLLKIFYPIKSYLLKVYGFYLLFFFFNLYFSNRKWPSKEVPVKEQSQLEPAKVTQLQINSTSLCLDGRRICFRHKTEQFIVTRW